MKIAFATTADPLDVHTWSGIPSHMVACLKKQALTVDCLGPLVDKQSLYLKLKRRAYRGFLGKRFLPERIPARLKNLSQQVARKLEGKNYDLVFSSGSMELAYLDCKEPMAFWADATFAGMIDFYSAWTNLAQESIRDGNAAEQGALDKCKLAIYSSDWAARSAIEHYKINPAKIEVVSFGANLECNRTLEDIDRLSRAKKQGACKLLFLGVEWIRKGGPLSLQVAEKLNEMGLPTELTIVGAIPPNPQSLPPYVKALGFISKSTEEGRHRIQELLQESQFLIMPSIAECTPIAFCEANSFGLPCLATNVGGIPSVIRNDVNGTTFALDARPEEYCKYIIQALDASRYRELAASSFNEYQTRLNWTTAGETVKKLLEAGC
jgi:glycosyltransferase involved in cell wall biosynthesis